MIYKKMSISVSNLGWERRYREPWRIVEENFKEQMMHRQQRMDRMLYNGEVGVKDQMKNVDFLYKEVAARVAEMKAREKHAYEPKTPSTLITGNQPVSCATIADLNRENAKFRKPTKRDAMRLAAHRSLEARSYKGPKPGKGNTVQQWPRIARVATDGHIVGAR